MKKSDKKQVFYIRIKELREAFEEIQSRSSSKSLSNSDSKSEIPGTSCDHDSSESDVSENSGGDHPFFV